MKQFMFAAAVFAALAGSGVVVADDQKTPDDKCPPGTSKVTIEKTISGDIKPGGVGVGSTIKETREVCRDNKETGVKESASKDTGGKDKSGKESASKDTGGKDKGGKESASKDTGGRDRGGKDTGGRDRGGRDTGGRDRGGKK